MKRRLALVWILALVYVACDAQPTELELESPDPTDHPSAGVVEVGENQFAVDFNAYEANQRLWEADWTRIARRWPMDSEPVLGDWRAQDTELSFAGRVAALLDPPLGGRHRIALQWDELPILEPPLEILTQLWLPPAENHPRVGIAWFIQEPDETGMLNGFALVRNALGSVNNGFFMTRLHENTRAGTGSGKLGDGFENGGWTWIRLRHTVEGVRGTVRYRAWQGELEDEPSQWDAERTSTGFGPDLEPPLSGGAGLYVGNHEKMAGIIPLWGAFTVGINGAPAPPPPSGEDVEVRIVEVETAGPGRSFTSGHGEKTVRVRAEVTPEEAGESTEWMVLDVPGDEVAAVPPMGLDAGLETEWDVPSQEASRWNGVPHPGSLDQKSLAFRIVASVTSEGERHESEPEEVRQDEIDTIRQEYLDLGRKRHPARSDLGRSDSPNFTAAELNHGDYGYWWANPRLLDGLEEVREGVRRDLIAAGRTFTGLVLTSAFRNPVHHSIHVGAAARESQHQYGTAADIRVWGHDDLTRTEFFDLLRRVAKKAGACYEPEQTIRAHSTDGKTLTHAHLAWQGDCPGGW